MLSVNLVAVPQPFRLDCVGNILVAFQLNGPVSISCEVPGTVVDWVGNGCVAMCSIAEGLLVIHERGANG
jgi:hypothetical protein